MDQSASIFLVSCFLTKVNFYFFGLPRLKKDEREKGVC